MNRTNPGRAPDINL